MAKDEVWGDANVGSKRDVSRGKPVTNRGASAELPGIPVERGKLNPSKKEMAAAWYPKGPDGKPVPAHKLTEHDKALIISNGDEKNIVIKGGHSYAKKNKRRR